MNLIANFALLASRRDIFGQPVCDFGWSGALSFIDQLASLPFSQTVVSFLNAHNANILVRDGDYRDALQGHLVLPDGIGLDIASSVLHGASFPANLNGTDFVPALLTYMEQPKRIGLLGASAQVIETAARNLGAHAPWHEFVVIGDGFFDKEDCEPVVEKIAREKLDILIVGMGTPLQEKWVTRHIRAEHVRLVLTVGALFDFAAGAVPRAPQIIRRLRLEWLYRLSYEPKRLWRRYILGIPMFLFHLVNYRFRKSYPRLKTGSAAADTDVSLPALARSASAGEKIASVTSSRSRR